MPVTEAQIRANRENARKSTGPRTEAGKDWVKNNALKHGMRSRTPAVLPQEDPAELELRLREWIEDWNPANAIERELVTLAARASWALERSERYEAALLSQRVREALLRSKARRLEEVGELAHQLFSLVSRGPYPTETAHAAATAAALEDSPEGVRWMLDRWGEIRGLIDVDMHWTYCDQFKFVRLLGKRPIDAVDDPELNAVFLAWEALEKDSGVEFWERMQTNSPCNPAFNSCREWRELAPRPADPAEAVARLLAVVDGEVERLKERLAVVEEAEGDDAVELAECASFAADDAGERLRRAQSARSRELLRAIQTLTKLRKESAREPGKRVPAAPTEREGILPSPLVGEGGRRPDEGDDRREGCIQWSAFETMPAPPHPAPAGPPSPARGEGCHGPDREGRKLPVEPPSSAPSGHLLPQGEKGGSRLSARPEAVREEQRRNATNEPAAVAIEASIEHEVRSIPIDASARERTRPGGAAV